MSRGEGERSRTSQAGVALLLAIWLLTLLAVIAGEFLASGRVRAAAERNRRDDLAALALAQAGFRAALAALDGRITGLSLDAEGRLLLHYRGAAEPAAAVADEVPLGGGFYSWRISDEDGLVNINTAPASQIGKLLQQCGLGPGAERDMVVDSILDWRDSNREHHLNGAEEDYYRGLEPPYSCKDGPFDVVEELLLVRGVSGRLFAGGEEEGRKLPGLRDLVSPHAGALNAGTAPQAVLDALGRQRPSRPTAPSQHYAIVATGRPAGNAPPRSLRAVVLREDDGSGGFDFRLVYYNDTDIPDVTGKRGES